LALINRKDKSPQHYDKSKTAGRDEMPIKLRIATFNLMTWTTGATNIRALRSAYPSCDRSWFASMRTFSVCRRSAASMSAAERSVWMP
jgi:hypothetical protein